MEYNIDDIINRYGASIYRTALARTRSRPDAEDIFQEVFFICYKKKPDFSSYDHCKAWLIRTTLLCCKKYWSSSKLKRCTIKDTLTTEMAEDESSVYYAVMELPKKYRIVIWLFYFEDMSINEIHGALKLKPSTIRCQLTRGRKMLKEKLKGEYFHEFEK